MKMKKRVLLFMLTIAVTVSLLFAGGSRDIASGGSDGPTPLRILGLTHGRSYDESLPNIQEILKRTNTVITEMIRSDSIDARNLAFASNDLPDLIQFGGMDFQRYVSTGYLKPLDDLLRSNGQNFLRNTSEDAWNLLTIQNRIYAVPFESNQIKHYTFVRKDWLNNLGIDLSNNADYGDFGGKVVTLDEYRDILIQFTRNDPDRNGRNDTYGIGSSDPKPNFGWANIYGAFGGMPGHYYIVSVYKVKNS